MLVGNSGFIPITPATYLPGQGRATTSSQINKMPYSTETFSTLSATLTFSSSSVAAFNSRVNGYALATGASTNKFNMSTDTNASFSNTNPQMFTNGVGQVPDTSGIYVTNTTTSAGGTVLYTWVYATDTTSNSTALQAHAANFGISGTFALNTNGTNVYFGGGTPAGSYVYGGFIKYASTTATSTLTYSDTNPNSRSATPGANNGSTAGYLAGGIKMPYTTITSEIRKLTYSTEVITALSGTLTTLRDWVTTGIQYGVCAYYGGGRATSGSAAVSVTTVEKFSFATETSANLASASINRDGFNSWNTL
jgi:hypothetical protein